MDIASAIDRMRKGDLEAADVVKRWLDAGGEVPDGVDRTELLFVATVMARARRSFEIGRRFREMLAGERDSLINEGESPDSFPFDEV